MKTLYIVLVLIAAAAAYAVSGSGGGNPGVDEYGTIVTMDGVFRERPYQLLEVTENGEVTTWILTAQGKSDPMRVIDDLEGRHVTITGTRIFRSNLKVFEVEGIQTKGSATSPPLSEDIQGSRTLRGEIVDSKCAAGRMKPEGGVVHRECAIRCIKGGIPPTLMVRSGEDVSFYLLENLVGGRVNKAVLPFVADPVEIEATLHERGGLKILRFSPGRIVRLN